MNPGFSATAVGRWMALSVGGQAASEVKREDLGRGEKLWILVDKE